MTSETTSSMIPEVSPTEDATIMDIPSQKDNSELLSKEDTSIMSTSMKPSQFSTSYDCESRNNFVLF